MDRQKETGHFSCNAGGLWGRGFLSMTNSCPGPEQSKSCPALEGAQGALHTRGGSFYPERQELQTQGLRPMLHVAVSRIRPLGEGEEAGHRTGLGGSWGRLGDYLVKQGGSYSLLIFSSGTGSTGPLPPSGGAGCHCS